MHHKRIPAHYRLVAIPEPIFDVLRRNSGNSYKSISVNQIVQEAIDQTDLTHAFGFLSWYCLGSDDPKVPIKKVLVCEEQFDYLYKVQQHYWQEYSYHVQISDILGRLVVKVHPDLFTLVDAKDAINCYRGAVIQPSGVKGYRFAST